MTDKTLDQGAKPRRRLTPRMVDWFILLPVAVSITMIGEIDPPRESVWHIGQLAQGGVVTILGLAITILVAACSAIDRRSSEEYLFQIVANAALVAIVSTSLLHLLWLIGIKTFDLPDLSGENMIGVMTLTWALAYYWFRRRGIAR